MKLQFLIINKHRLFEGNNHFTADFLAHAYFPEKRDIHLNDNYGFQTSRVGRKNPGFAEITLSHGLTLFGRRFLPDSSNFQIFR
jgi:hypothetical protein